MTAARKRAVPGEERVFSLVLALVASPQGLTKRDLLATVYGYAESYEHGVTDPALERKFDRDKEQLRALGVPIETIDSPDAPGDTQLARYRIRKDRLQVPSEVRFSARELSLLRLASLAWSEGSLSAESRRAAMKLEALGAGLDVRHIGIAPHLGMPEAAAPALRRAIDEGREVRFAYQVPERDAPMLRHVAPLHLHYAEDRWHLIAWDLERDADRVFLLTRIAGEVRVLNERFSPELRGHVDPALARLLALPLAQRAVVAVTAGSSAEARLLPRADPDTVEVRGESRVLTVGTLDLPILVSELAGFGEDTRVIEPADVRERVIDLLSVIRDQHATPAVASRDPHSATMPEVP